MKAVVTGFVVLMSFVSSTALACNPREAQFIGRVVAKTVTVENTCALTFGEFSYYGESIVCPLDIDEVSTLSIKDDSCKLEVGDEVSGVLSVDGNSDVSWQ